MSNGRGPRNRPPTPDRRRERAWHRRELALPPIEPIAVPHERDEFAPVLLASGTGTEIPPGMAEFLVRALRWHR